MEHREIILVGGSASWRKSSEECLRRQGYKAINFSEIREAIAYLRKYSADLLLVDFNEIRPAKALWKRTAPTFAAKLRTVFLLNSESPDRMTECFKLGAYDCVLKPLDENSLRSIVDDTLVRP